MQQHVVPRMQAEYEEAVSLIKDLHEELAKLKGGEPDPTKASVEKAETPKRMSYEEAASMHFQR